MGFALGRSGPVMAGNPGQRGPRRFHCSSPAHAFTLVPNPSCSRPWHAPYPVSSGPRGPQLACKGQGRARGGLGAAHTNGFAHPQPVHNRPHLHELALLPELADLVAQRLLPGTWQSGVLLAYRLAYCGQRAASPFLRTDTQRSGSPASAGMTHFAAGRASVGPLAPDGPA